MGVADGLIRTLTVLHGEGPEVAHGFLHAAVYAEAISTGRSPRAIVDALFVALPSEASWPQIRDALVRAVELAEEEGGPG